MNILSQGGKRLINYDNVVSLETSACNIIAIFHDGSCKTLAAFYTEKECENTFNKLCDNIIHCKENGTIDLRDLWDD